MHTPFCRHRCGYCNFAVVAGRDDLADGFLSALATELSWLGEPQPVETLYLGGGTPTHLVRDQLAELLALSSHWFPAVGDLEWTVEANPGDLDPGKIRLLADHGVTRLSLGVQSFDRAKLRRLERDHEPEDVARVVGAARETGLAVAIDLIFAAPEETLDGWSTDLDTALDLQPEHVSTYGLTYEKGTSFWSRRRRGDLSEADEGLQRAMYELAIERLTAAGFEHYEVSNFARPGKRSRHNETYWRGDPWHAAGPGAARYVGGVRETNHRSTTTWMRRIAAGESPVAEREVLAEEEQARERLVFGLRRLEGVERAAFTEKTTYTVDELAGEAIRRLVGLGLLADDGSTVKLTREGLLVSDAIWPELL